MQILDQNCSIEIFLSETDSRSPQMTVPSINVSTNSNMASSSLKMNDSKCVNNPNNANITNILDDYISQQQINVQSDPISNGNTTDTNTNQPTNIHYLNVKKVREKVNKRLKEATNKLSGVIIPNLKLRSASEIKPIVKSVIKPIKPVNSSSTTESSDSARSEIPHNIICSTKPVKAVNSSSTIESSDFARSDKNSYSKIAKNWPQEIDEILKIKQMPFPQDGDQCFVSFVESPSHFYIQIVREASTLIDQLSEQVGQIASMLKPFPTKLDALKDIKKYCLCYCENSGWYRAEIRKWIMEDDNMIFVRLIDYGISLHVPWKNIRRAVSYLFELPIMAVQCRLAWIKPVETENWPTEIIYFFKEFAENRLFTVCFSENNENEEIVDIDLRISDFDRSLIGFMIDENLASEDIPDEEKNHLQNDFFEEQVLEAQGLNQYVPEETALENEEGEEEEMSDPTAAVAHYVPRDEKNICRIYLKRGHCFKKCCKFSHEPLNPNGWTTDRELVFYDTFLQMSLPDVGNEILLTIINILDLSTFYGVIRKQPDNDYLLALQPLNTMKKLVYCMNSPKQVETYKKCESIPTTGQFILVRYNDYWQRAKVIYHVEYANRVELMVYLVDFGMDFKIHDMNEVRQIKVEYLYLPFQAIKCTLSNVVAKSGITDKIVDKGFHYLDNHILDKKLKAKVTFNLGYLSVKLYNKDGLDIAEEMLKAGFLERRTDYNPTPESGLLAE